jgi:hypothetical protein
MEADMVAEPTPQPFDWTMDLDYNRRNLQVYVKSVEKGGAAEKAGIRPKDVVVKMNGQPAGNVMAFIRVRGTLSAGEMVTFTLRRGNKEIEASYELPKRSETSEPDEEEGGWAYYPEMGESPSFSTAAAVLALLEVKDDMKIKGLSRVLRDPLKAAGKLIDSLRVEDKENGGLECYVYRATSKTYGQIGIDVRGTQGRNAICELTLYRLHRFHRSKGDLKKILNNWVNYRGELDAVRRMEYYAPPGKRGSPHNIDRWFNAAYYWLFGHYHTLLAAKEVGGKTFDEINEICVKAMMLTKYDDGTWLGHPSFGKLCGTCLGLWILGETEGPWRDDYGDPITQQKKDKGPVTPEK